VAVVVPSVPLFVGFAHAVPIVPSASATAAESNVLFIGNTLSFVCDVFLSGAPHRTSGTKRFQRWLKQGRYQASCDVHKTIELSK
jgi:hypothetical protein